LVVAGSDGRTELIDVRIGIHCFGQQRPDGRAGESVPCLIIFWELKARVSPLAKERRECLLFGMSH